MDSTTVLTGSYMRRFSAEQNRRVLDSFHVALTALQQAGGRKVSNPAHPMYGEDTATKNQLSFLLCYFVVALLYFLSFGRGLISSSRTVCT